MSQQPVNPYCQCDPCHCEHPCICGLRKTEHHVSTDWDAAQQMLNHTIVERYRPDPAVMLEQIRRHRTKTDGQAAPDGHPHDAQSESDAETPFDTPVVSPDVALEQSIDSAARRASVLQKYRALATTHDDHHQGGGGSVRSVVHRGHAIEIRTHYDITIDGEPMTAHLGVSNDGRVHYHGLPNYISASVVDLMKSLIDAFPDDFPPRD